MTEPTRIPYTGPQGTCRKCGATTYPDPLLSRDGLFWPTVSDDNVDFGKRPSRDRDFERGEYPADFEHPRERAYCSQCAAIVGYLAKQYDRDAAQRERVVAATPARRRALVASLPHHSLAIESLAQYGEADADAEATAEALSAWLLDPTRNLYLFGEPGVGKSTGAALAALDYFDADPTHRVVAWVNVKRTLAAMRAHFNGGPPVNVPLDAGLLVFDDLGAERATDWTREIVSGWIDYRYDNGGPVIATGNFAPSELAGRLGTNEPLEGKRIVRRLVGHGAVILNVKGPDRSL